MAWWMAIGSGVCPALGQIPPALLDAQKYLQEDVYDLVPARRAEWERERYALNEIWIGLGSYNQNEFNAVERGTVNLPLTSWLLLHGDGRNDRDRDATVRRVVFDALFRVRPWLWMGPSGAVPIPASQKDTFAIGASVLIADSERRRYLMVRLILDSFFFNRINLDNAVRASTVYHPEVEARWSSGGWSLYGLLDLTSPSEIRTPTSEGTRLRASSRLQLQAHARYQREKWEADARFDLLSSNQEESTDAARSGIKRVVTTTRLDVLWAAPSFPSGLRLRGGTRFLTESSRGQGDDRYRLSRIEGAVRVAGVWQRGSNAAEIGYEATVAHFSFARYAIFDTPYEDRFYGYWEYSFNPRFHLRAMLTWDLSHGHFGGGNGVFLAQF
jgi:hypothetical protein